jgi:hypothetical protein
MGDPTITVSLPPELTHPSDLEEFLSVKGCATFAHPASPSLGPRLHFWKAQGTISSEI